MAGTGGGAPRSEELAALARAAAHGGIFCDFDGCLAPIVADPNTARAVRGARAVLERLAATFQVVAVVSGRSIADLSARVRARGVRLIGLHGMEELRDGAVRALGDADAARARVERAAARIEVDLGKAPGAALERKGLALAVHFRRSPDPIEAERLATPLVHEAAALEGLSVVPGRRILEVRPKDVGDKGDAIRRIIAEDSLRAGMACGDDVGDLPAFDALIGLETRIRVAVASPEAPPALIEVAEVVVQSPRALVALLKRLAEAAG